MEPKFTPIQFTNLPKRKWWQRKAKVYTFRFGPDHVPLVTLEVDGVFYEYLVKEINCTTYEIEYNKIREIWK